jgi:uncharacterized protein (TIGR02145 family)
MNTCSLLLFSFLILLTKLSYSQTVTIGNQVWMTKNLNVDTFRNGDKIPEAKTAEEWVAYGKAGKAAWCYYDNDPANGEKYGKLYNGYAVSDLRNLAPNGWHIPNDYEWDQLIDFLGGLLSAGMKMKSTSGWIDKDGNSCNGSNMGGFSGLPGGNRVYKGTFVFIGISGHWWSSNGGSSASKWARLLQCGSGGNAVYKYPGLNDKGLSVRCIKD